MKRFKMSLLVLLLIVTTTIIGCATAGGLFNDTNTNVRIVTKGTVAEYLAHNKKSIDPFIGLSTDALTYIDSSEVPIEQLEVGLLTKLKPSLDKLTPEGKMGVLAFIDILKPKLKSYLKANNITDPAQVKLAVKTLVQWIHDASVEYKALI